MICTLTDPRHLDPKLFAFGPSAESASHHFTAKNGQALELNYASLEANRNGECFAPHPANGSSLRRASKFFMILFFIFLDTLIAASQENESSLT